MKKEKFKRMLDGELLNLSTDESFLFLHDSVIYDLEDDYEDYDEIHMGFIDRLEVPYVKFDDVYDRERFTRAVNELIVIYNQIDDYEDNIDAIKDSININLANGTYVNPDDIRKQLKGDSDKDVIGIMIDKFKELHSGKDYYAPILHFNDKVMVI